MKKLLAIMISISVLFAMSIPAYAASLSKDGALKTVLKDAGLKKSQIKSLEIDYDDDDHVYDIEFKGKKNKNEYEYEITKSGRILEKEVDYKYKKSKSKKKIGKAKAQKKAAKHAGVSLKNVKKGTCKYTYKKHQGKYKIKFRSKGYKYEYEILAPNGKIIEMEYEYLD